MPANLLPQPRSVRVGTGVLSLGDDLAISGETAWAPVVRRLVAPATGWELPSRPDGRLRLSHNADLKPEAYHLEVNADAVEIEAADSAGLTWGVQTLRQLMGVDAYRPAPIRDRFVLDQVVIDDAPRFGWRGVMLDVARHFRPLSELLRFVDLLSLHKYNVFHLHLTDDQGWRLASDRYPRLQEVASWRSETLTRNTQPGDGTPHGGFYTADQLRSLVRYAADRGITIVPEIDLPGHVRAVLAAYPELGNQPDTQHEVATSFGIFPEVLSLNETSLQFVFDVFTELLEIFPESARARGRRRMSDRGMAGQPGRRRPRRGAWPGRSRGAAALVHRAAAPLAGRAGAADWSAGTRSATASRAGSGDRRGGDGLAGPLVRDRRRRRRASTW